MQALAGCEGERMPDMGLGINVSAGRICARRRRRQGEIDAAGVDDPEFDQAAFSKRLDMGEPDRWVREVKGAIDVGGVAGA